MIPYRTSRPVRIVLIVFFIIVLGYAYYEAQGILYGPQLTIATQLTEVHEPYIVIKGKADRIASLSVDGSPIPVTESGVFEEPYLLAPGHNRITFDAKDTYGRNRATVVEIVYTPTSTPQIPAISNVGATTTPQPQIAQQIPSVVSATSSIATSSQP